MNSGRDEPRSRRTTASLCLLALLVAAALVETTADAQAFDHQAVTVRPAIVQGEVRTSAETWQCKGDYCATRARTATLPKGACARLAAVVGAIESFGPVKAKPLSAADLAACNASARLVDAESVGDEPAPVGVPPPGPPVPRPPTDRTLYFGNMLIADFDGGPVVFSGETRGPRWFCFDRVCFANVVDRLPSVEECRDLNLNTAFRIVAITSPRGRFSPEQIRACNKPEVIALEFVITTGRDGIRRSDSEVAGIRFLTMTRTDSAAYASHFYFHEGLTERSTESRTVPVGDYHRSHALALADLRSITLSFRSGSTRAAFEQGDAWDLAALTIRAHMQEMDGSEWTKEIYRDEGYPLHRFESGDDWEIPFTEPVFGD